MPNYEEQMQREMEEAAKEQQIKPAIACPIENEVDAAFALSLREEARRATRNADRRGQRKYGKKTYNENQNAAGRRMKKHK